MGGSWGVMGGRSGRVGGRIAGLVLRGGERAGECVQQGGKGRVCIRASATRFWLSGSGAIGATPREGCGYIDTHTHIPPCKIHHGVRTACLTGRGVCVHMPPSCDTAGDFDLDFTGAQPSLPPCEGAHGVFVAYLAGRDGLYTVAPPSLPPCEDAHRIA